MNRAVDRCLLGMAVALCAAFVLDVAVHYPCNHGGGIGGYFACMAGLMLIAAAWNALNRKIQWRFWLGLGAFGVLLVLVDVFNVMLPYEEWIARGMPEWGCRTQCARIIQ